MDANVIEPTLEHSFADHETGESLSKNATSCDLSLRLAEDEGDVTAVEKLLDNSCNINVHARNTLEETTLNLCDDDRHTIETPLTTACSLGATVSSLLSIEEVKCPVKSLLKYDVDSNPKCAPRPLIVALGTGSPNVIDDLVMHAIETASYREKFNVHGDTMLTCVCRDLIFSKRDAMVKLLNNGADPDALNFNNESPADIMLSNGDAISMLLLLRYGSSWRLIPETIGNTFDLTTIHLSPWSNSHTFDLTTSPWTNDNSFALTTTSYQPVSEKCVLEFLFMEANTSLLAKFAVLILAGFSSAYFNSTKTSYPTSTYTSYKIDRKEKCAAEVCKLLVLSGYRPASADVDSLRETFSEDPTPVRTNIIGWLDIELSSPASLMKQCRLCIRRKIAESHPGRTLIDLVKNELVEFPNMLKQYLMFTGPLAEPHFEIMLSLFLGKSIMQCRFDL